MNTVLPIYFRPLGSISHAAWHQSHKALPGLRAPLWQLGFLLCLAQEGNVQWQIPTLPHQNTHRPPPSSPARLICERKGRRRLLGSFTASWLPCWSLGRLVSSIACLTELIFPNCHQMEIGTGIAQPEWCWSPLASGQTWAALPVGLSVLSFYAAEAATSMPV